MTSYASGVVHNRVHHIIPVIIMVLASMIGLGSVVSAMSVQDSSADLVQWFMCNGSDDDNNPSLRKMLYEKVNSEDFERYAFFKSEVNAEAESATQSLANVISGNNYDKVQTDILNTGNATSTKYTVYDRFGFSGMKFTDYNGEWNYYKVYYCRANGQGTGDSKATSDAKLNAYYTNRDRPMDTYSGKSSSLDPRSRQGTSFANNWNLVITNFLFSITKMLTALLNGLLSLSMTDVATKLGVTDYVAGHGGTQGIYGMLFRNLFMQMITIMVVLTAVYMIAKGLVQGHQRAAWGGLITTLLCLIAGFVLMSRPLFFVNLPNTIGMVGQEIALSGISSVTTSGGDGDICTSSGSKDYDVTDASVSSNIASDKKSVSKQLSDMGSAVRRNLECEYYKVFTLQPYALGQYGTTYSNLYAEGKAASGGKTLGNTTSSSYTGLAPVPLGNKKVINNWVIYQISTQSSNHIGSDTIDQSTGKMTKPDSSSKYKSASQYESQLVKADQTNTDWWRVVDALANYKSGKTSTTTSYWNVWVGNDNMYRMLIALLSLVFAVLGMIAPIILGLSVIAYGVASVLVMGFAPIALMFGMWAGPGMKVLKGWAQLLITVVVRRVIMGLVFMLTVVIMIKITNGITGSVGYFKSMILLCLVSFAIAKNRKVFIDMVGTVNLGGVDLTSGASVGARKGIGVMTGAAKGTALMASAGAIGAAVGVKNQLGGSLSSRVTGKGTKGAARKTKAVAKGATKGSTKAMGSVMGTMFKRTGVGRQAAEAQLRMTERSGGMIKETIRCDNCHRIIVEAGNRARIGTDYKSSTDGRRFCMNCANRLPRDLFR